MSSFFMNFTERK